MSVNITVNRTANFTCTAVASTIEWEVNGQPVDDAEIRSRGFDDSSPLILLDSAQNLYTRTMSAFGSVDNNGSSITCVAILLVPFSTFVSEPAVLLVFESGIHFVHTLHSNIGLSLNLCCTHYRYTTTTTAAAAANMHCKR